MTLVRRMFTLRFMLAPATTSVACGGETVSFAEARPSPSCRLRGQWAQGADGRLVVRWTIEEQDEERGMA